MDKIIFLDRDGTINEEVNYLYRPEDLIIIAGVAEAIKVLNHAGFKVVVVTNQAGVARGFYSEQDVAALHEYLNERLKSQGAHIDMFFYCPHHPEYGVGTYKTKCECRKPGTGMLEMAARYYDIDKAHSYMIGDKLLDVDTGVNYGISGILVGTGYGAGIRAEGQKGGEEENYAFYAENLMDAVQWIMEREGA